MSNFKIARANLKRFIFISSLRMPHFKIAHISTLLATITQNVSYPMMISHRHIPHTKYGRNRIIRKPTAAAVLFTKS